ncbi:MAG: ferritin-like domain-containing protein [Chloroflexota bacterium]|nr:ferritin-like domain-containing protein [Chloroflexota bacterium]
MFREQFNAELLERATSRRGFLKGASAVGLTAAGVSAFPGLASAAGGTDTDAIDPPSVIFNVAITAEQLAVTFYTNGVKNAKALGLSGNNLDYIKAALLEEQIHELFFASNGGVPTTSTFSFPAGPKTFTDLKTFIDTQQILEGAFDSAFIAAVYEFSVGGFHDLARVAAQIAMIEEGHRELGLTIINAPVADNEAFAPQLVSDVNDAPVVLAAAGFLSPVPGNSYTYEQVNFGDPALNPIFKQITFKHPYVRPEFANDDGGSD